MFKKTKLCKGLMLAFGGSLALASLPSLAQQAAAPAQLDRVEVTGSAIKRIEGEGLDPKAVWINNLEQKCLRFDHLACCHVRLR